MLNEKECKKALEILQEKYLNFDVVDELICFKRLIKEHFNPQPYKFEDLKPNMWVWDDKFNDCMKIKIVFERCELYPSGSLKAYHDLNEEELNFIEFEENRFFPITKALQYQ